MRLKSCWLSLVLGAVLIPLAVIAQNGTEPLESDWLELVKGYRCDTLGTELVEIEEVVVIGRKPEEPEPLDITYEWLDDYDNDKYGLVIRLGKNTRWPIRLYMNSDAGFIR